MQRREHWNRIYESKAPAEVSWFQIEPEPSLGLIRSISSPSAAVIDVGGGLSPLTRFLLRDGYRDLTVLDVSLVAVERARSSLRNEQVEWIVSDVTTATFAPARYDVWHDRAVFHFLTSDEDRALYIAQVRRAVKPGGHIVMGTFADDGPTRCSGLDVRRYSAQMLVAAFGNGFNLVRDLRHQHTTPSGAVQRFVYGVMRFEDRETVAVTNMLPDKTPV